MTLTRGAGIEVATGGSDNIKVGGVLVTGAREGEDADEPDELETEELVVLVVEPDELETEELVVLVVGPGEEPSVILVMNGHAV